MISVGKVACSVVEWNVSIKIVNFIRRNESSLIFKCHLNPSFTNEFSDYKIIIQNLMKKINTITNILN